MNRYFSYYLTNYFLKLALLIIVAHLLVLFTLPNKAYALCDEPSGAGAVFNDFKKIIIYFSYFSHADDQRVEGYPEALKTNKFKDTVVSTIRKNFSQCLDDGSPEGKPIIIEVQPTKEMSDPDNLVIVMQVSYRKDHHMTDGIEDYGFLHFQLFRAGLSNEDALLVAKNNNGSIAIFPRRGEAALNDQIARFLKLIRPIKYPIPNPEGHYWKEMEKNWQ